MPFCTAPACNEFNAAYEMVDCAMCNRNFCTDCSKNACTILTPEEAAEVVQEHVAIERAAHERVLQAKFTPAERAALPFQRQVRDVTRKYGEGVGPLCHDCRHPDEHARVDDGDLIAFLCARLGLTCAQAMQQCADARTERALRARLDKLPAPVAPPSYAAVASQAAPANPPRGVSVDKAMAEAHVVARADAPASTKMPSFNMRALTLLGFRMLRCKRVGERKIVEVQRDAQRTRLYVAASPAGEFIERGQVFATADARDPTWDGPLDARLCPADGFGTARMRTQDGRFLTATGVFRDKRLVSGKRACVHSVLSDGDVKLVYGTLDAHMRPHGLCTLVHAQCAISGRFNAGALPAFARIVTPDCVYAGEQRDFVAHGRGRLTVDNETRFVHCEKGAQTEQLTCDTSALAAQCGKLLSELASAGL